MVLMDVKHEQMIDGMTRIIRRMCRVAPRGDLVLANYDEREIASLPSWRACELC